MDIKEIEKAVGAAARQGPLADFIQGIAVEADQDEDNEDFLRVMIQLRHVKKNVDAELEAMLERIEETLAGIDNRYPSVRFLDAA